MTSPSSGTANCRPPLLPVTTHSLSTAYHLQKILAEVQDCVNDIISLDISTDVNQGSKNLLESVQWRFLDVLCQDWLRGMGSPLHCHDFVSRSRFPADANLFYHLESWTLESGEPATTSYPSLFELFQRRLIIVTYKIAVATESSHVPAPFTMKGIQNLPVQRKKPRAMSLINKVKKTFMDAIYAFLDGLVLLTTEDFLSVKELDSMRHLQRTADGLYGLFDMRDAVSDDLFTSSRDSQNLSSFRVLENCWYSLISSICLCYFPR